MLEMGFFELIGILVCLYYLINIILWLFLDSDIELFIKEKIGKPISDLQGKVIWITGASSGIGKHLAIQLAQNGVKICISARREEELEKVKKLCLHNNHTGLQANDILVLKMDMLEIDRHEEHFANVLKHFGQLDVLVNNAGRSQRANWETIDFQVDHEMFDLDVFSIVHLSRIYVRHIESSTTKKGHLVVTSSVAGIQPVPFSSSYVGAKFAINGYYASLKIEKPHIDVTIFCPGPTFTDFLQDAFTEKTGEKYNKQVKSTDRRMTGERCGFLLATSIANKTLLSFVGPFPVVMIVYISMYYPNLRMLLLKLIGKQGLQKIRDSEDIKTK